ELQPWLEQLKSGLGRITRLEGPMLSVAGDLSPGTAGTIRRDLPALLDRWTAAGRLLNQIRRHQSAPYLRARIDSLYRMLTAPDDGLLPGCDRILHQFELGEVVQGALRRFADNGADLSISESLLWRSHLDADPAPLQHLISDTVANAVQANGDRPRIRIEVEEADPTHMQIWIRDDGPAGAGEGVRRLSDARRDGNGRGCGMLNAVNVLKRLYDGDLEVREDVDGWGNSVGLRVRTAEHD
ncbi:MAG: hypothetical protein GF393_10335, partial [Armatimonadia bacterium]|nr:hypothetical protein [Armatimonadia bacterium]